MTTTPIEHSGTFTIGGDLTVPRLGFGAMRITEVELDYCAAAEVNLTDHEYARLSAAV